MEKWDTTPTWDTIVGRNHVKDALANKTPATMPNLLFHGPPGTGKTSMAYAIKNRANDILLKYPLHHYNASSKRTRGIEFIEEDIVPLVRSGMEMIILLDEADQLTPAAQMALKGVMENSMATFILTTNDLSKINDALVSRCEVFRFGKIHTEDCKVWLQHLCEKHNFNINDTTLQQIMFAHYGDLRAMTVSLETYAGMVYQGTSLASVKKDAARNFILKLSAAEFDKKLFLNHINDKNFKPAFEMLKKHGDIRSVLKEFLDEELISSDKWAEVITHIVTSYRSIQLGIPEEVVMAGFCKDLVLSTPLYPC